MRFAVTMEALTAVCGKTTAWVLVELVPPGAARHGAAIADLALADGLHEPGVIVARSLVRLRQPLARANGLAVALRELRLPATRLGTATGDEERGCDERREPKSVLAVSWRESVA